MRKVFIGLGLVILLTGISYGVLVRFDTAEKMLHSAILKFYYGHDDKLMIQIERRFSWRRDPGKPLPQQYLNRLERILQNNFLYLPPFIDGFNYRYRPDAAKIDATIFYKDRDTIPNNSVIVLTEGALSELTTDEELAGLLAHEFAHFELRENDNLEPWEISAHSIKFVERSAVLAMAQRSYDQIVSFYERHKFLFWLCSRERNIYLSEVIPGRKTHLEKLENME